MMLGIGSKSVEYLAYSSTCLQHQPKKQKQKLLVAVSPLEPQQQQQQRRRRRWWNFHNTDDDDDNINVKKNTIDVQRDDDYSHYCFRSQETACRLCVCCKGCPCTTNRYYFAFLFLAITIGIVIIFGWTKLITKIMKTKQKQKNQKESKTSTTESTTMATTTTKESNHPPSSSTREGSNEEEEGNSFPRMDTDDEHKDSTFLLENNFSKQELSIVLRAIDLWEQHDFLEGNLANKLRATTTTTTTRPTTTQRCQKHQKENQNLKQGSKGTFPHLLSTITTTSSSSSTRGSILSAVLITLSIVIALLESSRTATLLHRMVFGPWMWLFGDDQPIAKASAMLVLTMLAHSRVGGAMQTWEMTRVVVVFAYIGSLTYCVVDTGRHPGETTYDGRNNDVVAGSQLWYATIGACGAVAMLCFGQVFPEYYRYTGRWVSISMFVLSTAVSPSNGYLLWLYGLSSCLLLLGGGQGIGIVTFSFDKSTCDCMNIGTVYFILTAMLDEFCMLDELCRNTQTTTWTRGSWLGLISVFLITFGIGCHGSSFQAATATVGACLASFLMFGGNDEESCTNGAFYGLNTFLRLALLFTAATLCIGGLSEVIKLPPKTKTGCSVALVGTTLILLLVTIAVGNTHEFEEWQISMDFGSGRKWYELEVIDGDFSYANRGIEILPWALPFFIYYRTLSKLWPEMERFIRPYHSIRIALILVCLCHLMRLVSWSLLFLAFAGISICISRMESFIRGDDGYVQ